MKKRKVLVTLITAIMTLIVFSNITTVLATSGIAPSTVHVGSFEKAMKVILGIFEVVTVAFGIIMLIVLAIKYMTSAPGDKAEIKKHAAVYIVGACMAFGATGVLSIIKKFTEDAFKK